jgi:hypothetical protein
MRRTGARLDLLEREAADSGSGVRLECVVLRSRPESDEALRLQDVSQSDVPRQAEGRTPPSTPGTTMVGKDHAHPGGNMTRPSDSREEIRKNALTAFLEARVGEGFRVETYTDTHAIIVPADQRSSFLDRFRKAKVPARQVISVDEHGEVTMSSAEPRRS